MFYFLLPHLRCPDGGELSLEVAKEQMHPVRKELDVIEGTLTSTLTGKQYPIRNGIPRLLPGTIDSDYRGVISLPLINLGKEPYLVKRGARLAQMVLQEVTRAEIEEADELDETARNHGGFGHTGIHRRE